MKQKHLFIVLGAFIVAVILWSLFRPETAFIDKKVNEPLPQTHTTKPEMEKEEKQEEKILAQGTFQKDTHEISGTATVHQLADGKRILRLTNFSTSNGPDVRVLLVAVEEVKDSSMITKDNYIELGPLKGNKGDQNYDIPDHVDLSKYRSVSIWCERFSVNFGAASLKSS